jgi:peptidyl-prolyl cis-trans isomerase D
MFDLFRSRDKAVRIFLTALLSVVAISMVGYLIPGYGGSSGSTGDINVVAEIGKDKVTVRDVQQAIQNARRSREIDPAVMVFLIPQMVDQLVNEKAMAYQAARMGIVVTEADTAKAIRENVPQFFPDGKFIGREAYAAALDQQGMSIGEFEASMQKQLLLSRLRSLVLESSVVSKAEIEQDFKSRNEKASIEYVKILPDKIQAEVKLSPEELREYYEKNKLAFKVQEKRGFKLVVLDPAVVAGSVAVSDEQIRRAYDQNRDRFRTPDRVKARQILLMTAGKTPEEDAKIKAQAEDILKQIKAGGNFAELAAKYSEDPVSKAKGGDLDWVGRGQAPEFEQALFALKPNEVSSVLKGQYGYRIIQAVEKEQARLKPLEEVKAELAAELKKQLGQQQAQTTMDATVAALRKNPQQVDQIAAQYHLNVVNVPKAGQGEPIPELGINRDFENSVSTLKKGEVSQPVSAPGDRIIVAVVTDVFPTHQASFEEAQDQIRPQLTAEKTERILTQRSADLIAKAKSLNGDLKKAAQSMDLTIVSPPPFTRRDSIQDVGSPDLIPESFSQPVGSIFGPKSIGPARVVGKVTAREPADMAQLEAQTASIREDLKRTKARERNILFEDGIRQQLIKEGKIKIHEDVLKRVTSNNAG